MLCRVYVTSRSILPSISSTLNARTFRANFVFLVTFWLCQKIRTKNSYVKRWWIWHLLKCGVSVRLNCRQNWACFSERYDSITCKVEMTTFQTYFNINFEWLIFYTLTKDTFSEIKTSVLGSIHLVKVNQGNMPHSIWSHSINTWPFLALFWPPPYVTSKFSCFYHKLWNRKLIIKSFFLKLARKHDFFHPN